METVRFDKNWKLEIKKWSQEDILLAAFGVKKESAPEPESLNTDEERRAQ